MVSTLLGLVGGEWVPTSHAHWGDTASQSKCDTPSKYLQSSANSQGRLASFRNTTPAPILSPPSRLGGDGELPARRQRLRHRHGHDTLLGIDHPAGQRRLAQPADPARLA